VEQLLSDLREAVAHLRRNGPSVDREAFAREVASFEGRPLDEMILQLAVLAGITGPELPERMAPLNTILDLMPAETRDQLLAAYMNGL
jgi:hypothetical protein